VKWLSVKNILTAVVCLAPLALPILLATSTEFPSWAFPVDPPAPPGAKPPPPKDDGTLLHVPDSAAAFTRTQIRDTVPDWHPEDHPPMPDIVKNGKAGVRGCAYCHQPNGAGRPENTSLAGLTEAYIKQEVGNFRNGTRKGSEPRRALQNQMNEISSKVTDAEVAEAAAYFASLKLASFLKVVETDSVPKTIVKEGMLMKSPEGGTEPIGQRIIEVPEDNERAENRDSHSPYIAYVPKGAIARGEKIVTTGGGKTTACTTCHGPDLHGAGDVPHIAGRSPSYVIRQLFDIQSNHRTGSVAFMQQVVANLERDDMIGIAAYLASREP
jgi:cytochrome c553